VKWSALGAFTGAALPVLAGAQARERCDFPNTPQTSQTVIKLPSGQYNSFFGKGVRVHCPGKNLTLLADSLESYGDEQRIYLVGHVRYDEPRLSLTSDYLTYFQRDERFIAMGNVNAKLPNGSTLRGPSAEYHRVIPNVRPVPRLHSTGRPTITVVQKDSLGKPTAPVTVEANSVTMVGDSLVYSAGQVVVTREDIIARGDSLHLDSQREYTVLLRGPSIQGRRERPFTLFGDRIELTGQSKKLSRVLSTGHARAVSEDMTLASDTIDLRVAADLLQRAVAFGPSRARASSASQQILADSIDVIMPNQRLQEMHALRLASAEGRPDTIRFRADTVDWLRGDTIIARFDTAATRDSARTVRLRQLVAVGNARSYHHMAPADTAIRIPAINYVVGREITIAFVEQRVSKVTVRERASGAYLEPKSVAAKPDSTRASRPSRAPAAAPPGRPPR
jgi:lipopolysaccharide export system protein LptA